MLAAVIVTYNRKELLGNNIRMLLKQTLVFDRIFIVDNCSTDGTYDYLVQQGWMDNKQFVYVKPHPTLAEPAVFTLGPKQHLRRVRTGSC